MKYWQNTRIIHRCNLRNSKFRNFHPSYSPRWIIMNYYWQTTRIEAVETAVFSVEISVFSCSSISRRTTEEEITSLSFNCHLHFSCIYSSYSCCFYCLLFILVSALFTEAACNYPFILAVFSAFTAFIHIPRLSHDPLILVAVPTEDSVHSSAHSSVHSRSIHPILVLAVFLLDSSNSDSDSTEPELE